MKKETKEKKNKTPEQALASLMSLASRTEKSSGDARRLMRGWGISTADADAVLEKLTSHKFIDDERYATAYIREKLRLSGWGAHKIRSALAAKGIARTVIDNALGSLDRDAMDERLEKYLKRKKLMIKAVTPYEIRSKLVRYGLSLGYEYEQVSDVVDKLTIEKR